MRPTRIKKPDGRELIDLAAVFFNEAEALGTLTPYPSSPTELSAIELLSAVEFAAQNPGVRLLTCHGGKFIEAGARSKQPRRSLAEIFESEGTSTVDQR